MPKASMDSLKFFFQLSCGHAPGCCDCCCAMCSSSSLAVLAGDIFVAMGTIKLERHCGSAQMSTGGKVGHIEHTLCVVV